MHLRPVVFLFLSALASGGCVSVSRVAPTPKGEVRAGTPDEVNLALARARRSTQGEAKARVAWEPLSQATFDKARRENRLILLDGAAAWCHWCHVMDETTYADERIVKLLAERFVTIRVDIDERPDIAARYGEWGWPATIILSPEAEEIGKYRGYLPPDEMLAALGSAAQAKVLDAKAAYSQTSAFPASIEALPWIAARAAFDLDDWYDEKEGSWGRRQKSAIGANVLFELRRAEHGDGQALARVLFTLEKQRGIMDPVWGGVYQYSTGGNWSEPHYEKLMTYQASNLEAYALAYARTKRPDLLADARAIAGYMTTHLSGPEGGFFPSQDADVGAHDEKAAFIDGDVYYRLGDAARRKLGKPRVDEHVYGYENGLAIAALCLFSSITGDADALARAERAGSLIVKGYVDEAGLVRHDAKNESRLRHLADAASFGFALVRLAEVDHKGDWLGVATRIAEAMEKHLADTETGAFFAHTVDAGAVGVFARRDRPFLDNVLAARFLVALGRVRGDEAKIIRARQVLAALSTPAGVAGQGRMLGEFLLALDEVGLFPWPPNR